MQEVFSKVSRGFGKRLMLSLVVVTLPVMLLAAVSHAKIASILSFEEPDIENYFTKVKMTVQLDDGPYEEILSSHVFGHYVLNQVELPDGISFAYQAVMEQTWKPEPDPDLFSCQLRRTNPRHRNSRRT